MRISLAIFLLWLLPAHAGVLDGAEPVTLDPAAMANAWQTVRQAKSVASTPDVADAWKAAMVESDASLACVRLLAWLQQQNPLMPMESCLHQYAEALNLHRRALVGHADACALVADGYRCGQLAGLQLPASEEKARWFEQRAIVAGKLPE